MIFLGSALQVKGDSSPQPCNSQVAAGLLRHTWNPQLHSSSSSSSNHLCSYPQAVTLYPSISCHGLLHVLISCLD